MDLHEQVTSRLAALDQRYTRGRRALVETLNAAGRPLTVPELLAGVSGEVAQSSAYRNLGLLLEAGVVHRLPGSDEFARYELVEELSAHHHHVLCASCGAVADVESTPRLEKALADAARIAAEESGFEVTGHRIDLLGRCASCR